ncbi:hypothetical protein EFR84_32135 [Rhizobium chutanense]|uniref:Propionyl-coenzyme A carboxylase alpha polypeptide n=1 Tax=Rhizobium chutanense TaxID=2035448 RepID=A0A432NAW3_9HYPH|nr:hypothetical protein EFR84_32135 [Rhizobium chutanense]
MKRRPARLLLERDRQSGRHPPLSCRTSPPQGGRLAGGDGFPKQLRHCFSSNRVESERWPNLLPISLLVGEMSGRTEGGATPTHQSALHP